MRRASFVKASTDAVTRGCRRRRAASMRGRRFRVSITNAQGKGVCIRFRLSPWLLLYENPKDKGQARTMVEFVKWALTDGQVPAAPPSFWATLALPMNMRQDGDGG